MLILHNLSELGRYLVEVPLCKLQELEEGAFCRVHLVSLLSLRASAVEKFVLKNLYFVVELNLHLVLFPLALLELVLPVVHSLLQLFIFLAELLVDRLKLLAFILQNFHIVLG